MSATSPVYSEFLLQSQCGYRSKRCDRTRSFKKNGELHRFCDYHRMKANINQRRVDQRRREMTQKQTAGSISPRSTQDATFLPSASWCEDLDPKDLEYLQLLLEEDGEVDHQNKEEP
ncbi:hypothetical protein V7S43_004504 [Phytophthora oleae]|uniref:SBP-type domain-containing protein n=1 Tax=Phytophthora oleae TaxID=2107226 RepID=A0ABD3FYZ0_9STRA